jgi:hypothetical protein
MLAHCKRNGLDRLDYLSQQVAYIRRFSDLLLIFGFNKETVDRVPLDCYVQVLFFSLRLNVKCLCVWIESLPEEVVRTLSRRRTATKLIGCYITNVWDAARVSKQADQTASLCCDIIRITSNALTVKDNFDLLRAVTVVDLLPISAFNWGALGRLSRCLNQVLSPVEHRSLVDNRAS